MKKLSLFRREFGRFTRQRTPLAALLILIVCALALCVITDRTALEGEYTLAEYNEINRLSLAEEPKNRENYLNELSNDLNAQFAALLLGEDSAPVHETSLPFASTDIVKLIAYRNAMAAVLEDFNGAEHYDAYLQNLLQQGKRMNILGGLSAQKDFSLKNIEKTAQDYERLSSLRPKYDINAGVLMCSKTESLSVLLTLGTLLLCLLIYTGEQKQFALYDSMKKGRAPLTDGKLKTLFLYVVLQTVCVFGVHLCYAALRYGLGDASRPIQSVFRACPLPVSVWGYLGLTALWMALAQMLTAAFAYLLCQRIRSLAGISGIFALVLLLGELLGHTVSETGKAGFLKYTGLLSLSNPTPYLREYRNLNFFDTPLRLLFFALGWMVFFTLLFWIACHALARKGFSPSTSRRFSLPRRAEKKTRSLSVRLGRQEAWRFWIGRGILPLCAVFFALLLIRTAFFAPQMTVYERYIRTVTEQAARQEDPLVWLEEELEKEQDDLGNVSSLRAIALERVLSNYLHITSLENKNARLLYSGGYEQLFFGSINLTGTLILAFFITLMHVLCGRESIDGLLVTLPKSVREAPGQRRVMRLCAAAFVFLLCVFSDVYLARSVYSLPEPSAAAVSVSAFSKAGGLSLSALFLLTQLVRFLSLLLLSWLLHLLSRKNPLLALTASLILVILPLTLSLLGVSFASAWPLSRLLQGTVISIP